MQYSCDKCQKLFKTKQGHQNHYQKCNGIQSLECPYCFRLFNNQITRDKHMPKCNCKPPTEDTEATPASQGSQASPAPASQVSQDSQASQATQPNTNIIIFELDKNKPTQFNSSHISSEQMKAMINNHFKADDKHSSMHILSLYCDSLFSLPENKCIKKTSLESSYSEIHHGENKWSKVDDDNTYDKLLIDISHSLLNKLNEIYLQELDLQSKMKYVCIEILIFNRFTYKRMQ